MKKITTLLTMMTFMIIIVVPFSKVYAAPPPPKDSLVLKVYPSPAVDYIQIMPAPNTNMLDVMISIYDARGKQIFTRPFGDGYIYLYGISQWPVQSAVYFIRVSNSSGESQTLKFVKFKQ